MTVRHIFMCIETLLLFLFLVPFPVFNAGNILGLLFSMILIIITCNFDRFKNIISAHWQNTSGKIIISLTTIFIAACFIYAGILSILMYKAQENKPEAPNVIVVLGCKVKGERPTRMLKRRLDTAYEALLKHKDVKCIVSGGQGSDEVISEALAMKNYLIEKGIPENRIIMEDKSATTYENLKFSLKKLDELGMNHDITIVTDGFHQYRAGLLAKSLGINNVTAYSANTEARYLPTYWVREWLGITKFYLLNK